ncbi:cysteine-rich repeat secretory protein 38-like [Rhodamnia argentea]|uniref:Cysteine-rich repeat secretory protein 38-like n=1 Tax=Rhodamnia argentea TaxID=178133 RepID=A0A8B8QJG7_9MYRT|nr:cysteine-rich repeat secretory protein 38-like [Rhodamnia argentea]
MFPTKSIPLLLLSFFLLLSTSFGDDPLNDICFGKDNYTSGSPYKANLDSLLSALVSKVPPSGFATGSSGKWRNQAYGLALCRGDVSSSDCKSCVSDARPELLQRCPRQKGAIIWYDNCLLKYSDVSFFGKIDNSNKFNMVNVEDVDMDFMEFYMKIKELLNSLTGKAVAGPKKYAYGELELGEEKTLYGLVQCTRDLSGNDCKTCLGGAISDLRGCCYGRRGGRTIGGSCNVRYELYPFANV